MTRVWTLRHRIGVGIATPILLMLAGCGPVPDGARQRESGNATMRPVPSESPFGGNGAAAPTDLMTANASTSGSALPPAGASLRFVGRWAEEAPFCDDKAWAFEPDSVKGPDGATCVFTRVSAVAGGYDIDADCIIGGSDRDDRITLRFAESARAMLLESGVLPDTGLIYCGPVE